MHYDTTIKRHTKNEAERAMADLEARGYYEVFPLTEFAKEGKTFTRDLYNRKVFQENIYSSIWISKMRRDK